MPAPCAQCGVSYDPYGAGHKCDGPPKRNRPAPWAREMAALLMCGSVRTATEVFAKAEELEDEAIRRYGPAPKCGRYVRSFDKDGDDVGDNCDLDAGHLEACQFTR